MGRQRKKTKESEKLSCVLGIRISEGDRELLTRRAAERGYQDTGKYCRSILKNSELMNWSDQNAELRKIRYQISNLESVLEQMEKNIAYSAYPMELQNRFQDCVAEMLKISEKLKELLSDQEKNGEG